jgi:hypothetical protein
LLKGTEEEVENLMGTACVISAAELFEQSRQNAFNAAGRNLGVEFGQCTFKVAVMRNLQYRCAALIRLKYLEHVPE